VEYLHKTIGRGTPAPDARLEDVLASVPPSRLWDNPWISTDPGERLLHARGQSLPDWVALRSGQIGTVPDGGTALLQSARPMLQRALGWDDPRWVQELDAYRKLWARAYAPPALP
jgi:alkyldihydroxyacetonephosphate synthase